MLHRVPMLVDSITNCINKIGILSSVYQHCWPDASLSQNLPTVYTRAPIVATWADRFLQCCRRQFSRVQ